MYIPFGLEGMSTKKYASRTPYWALRSYTDQSIIQKSIYNIKLTNFVIFRAISTITVGQTY